MKVPLKTNKKPKNITPPKNMQGHWGNRGFCYTSAQAMHLHTGISEQKTSTFRVSAIPNATAMKRPLSFLLITYISIKCPNGFLFLANFFQILKCVIILPISNGNQHRKLFIKTTLILQILLNLFGWFLLLHHMYFILLPSTFFSFFRSRFWYQNGMSWQFWHSQLSLKT